MSSIQYGIVLPYGSPRRVADLAHLAEEAGWDGVFVGDAIWCLDPLIQLAAAAMTTRRIRLGTMVLATPLRIPWTLAGQAAALDDLSGGRLILGLGTGATWMGWQAFPDASSDLKDRTGKLDEMIAILTQMFQRKQFDFDGRHYHVKLSAMDPAHYPPATLQQPRIPIWVPGVWPRQKSLRRALKCDGLFPVKMDAAGKFVDLTPSDLAEMKTYIDAHRAPADPFDIIVEGRTDGLDAAQAKAKLAPWVASGMTWWVESTWGAPEEQLAARIRQGPPRP